MTRFGQGFLLDCSSTRFAAPNFKWWILSVTVFLMLQDAAAQSGFISIDCGSTSNYTDERGIEWSTDEGYIATGTNVNVSVPASLVDYGRQHAQLSTVRYFQSNRRRHCYVLPNVTFNNTYLIRPSFLYSDLADPHALPSDYSFSLAIDSSVVDNIRISANEADTLVTHEYYVVSRSEEIVFCLLPDKGAPFISSLELRWIEENSFANYMYSNQYGVLTHRLNCGANDTDPSIRYPDDPFDRIWETPGTAYIIPTVTADQSLKEARDGEPYDQYFFPPPPVMESAWSNQSIRFSVLIPGDQDYWACFHFSEVDGNLSARNLRVEDIYIYDQMWKDNYTIPHGAGSQALVWDASTLTGATNLNFTIHRYPNTTLQPLINAFEVHEKFSADTHVTDTSDRQVLDSVRESLNLMDWTGDPCFPIPWDWLTCSNEDPAQVTQIKLSNYQLHGTLQAEIAELPALQDLWLDGNFLTGTIPNLGSLKELQTLHLQNNSLTGTIPDTLADIPNLRELFLQNNKDLNSTVPAALADKSGLNLKVGSSNSSGASTPAPAPGSKSGSTATSVGVIIGAIVGGLAAVVVLLGGLIWCLQKRRKNAVSQQEKGVPHQRETTKPFSMAEVTKITNNFERQIGEGGFGPVYFGKLNDGTEVAVKMNSENSGQGKNEFLTEVKLLSRIHHRNLVNLIGFCDENSKRILIYKFMEEGTLKDHLYGRGESYALDWPTRLQTVIDAARGLEYLHYDCHPRIIHRDVKSSNILLNGSLEAKVADFGISKFYEEGMTGNLSTSKENTSSAVKGTFGYLDPEYFSTNRFTYKSDVYSFGVILLEIISSRVPFDCTLADEGQWILIDYARHMIFESNLEMFADSRLGYDYNKEAMWKVAELAMRCVEPRSMNRPDMREVVKELSEALQYGHWMESTSPQPGFEIESTTQTSKENFFPNLSAIPRYGISDQRSYQYPNSRTSSADSATGTLESNHTDGFFPAPR